LVRIDLPPEAHWALGQTARVGWAEPMRSSQAMVLPTSAVVELQGQAQVWVFEPEQRKVRPVPVQVLRYQGDQVVLGSGLRAGQQVVAMGGHTLTPGQEVTPYVGKNPSPQMSDLQPGGRP
jgi:multidrug efflux pump subunit AcrA (membrane-fusion protein)